MPVSQSFKFNFKTRAIKDDSGKEIGRSKKQPSIVVDLPVPSHEEIATFLTTGDTKEDGTYVLGKEASLVMSAVADIIYQAGREQFDEIIEAFGDDDTKVVAGNQLDYSRLDFSFIANLPPTARASTAPSEDDWKAFFSDYLSVMVSATGKEPARIAKHVEYMSKPTRIRNNKEVLGFLVAQLDMYIATSTVIEETGACAGRVREKFDRWHTEPEKAVDLSLL